MANTENHIAPYQAYYLRKESENTPSAQRANAYYNKVFQSLLAGKSYFSWNWSAAIFCIGWFAYRRMYGPALALLIFLSSVQLILESTLLGLTLFITLASFILGGFTNAFYVYWIKTRVQRGGGPQSEAVDTPFFWLLFGLGLSSGALEFFNPNYTTIIVCGMSLFLVFRFFQQRYCKGLQE